jgi:hypothetical protein|uniref:Uncharacterized protein n=1 Tax=Siphoviridae sp. ctnNB1 TaxID=2825660 RepID=A0A8S5UVJ2_9CAUD|nr:MAG TPA: hypothetical protein [Siphoviridae sp. ctnNB1]
MANAEKTGRQYFNLERTRVPLGPGSFIGRKT